jgi:hypothetical protein
MSGGIYSPLKPQFFAVSEDDEPGEYDEGVDDDADKDLFIHPRLKPRKSEAADLRLWGVDKGGAILGEEPVFHAGRRFLTLDGVVMTINKSKTSPGRQVAIQVGDIVTVTRSKPATKNKTSRVLFIVSVPKLAHDLVKDKFPRVGITFVCITDELKIETGSLHSASMITCVKDDDVEWKEARTTAEDEAGEKYFEGVVTTLLEEFEREKEKERRDKKQRGKKEKERVVEDVDEGDDESDDDDDDDAFNPVRKVKVEEVEGKGIGGREEKHREENPNEQLLDGVTGRGMGDGEDEQGQKKRKSDRKRKRKDKKGKKEKKKKKKKKKEKETSSEDSDSSSSTEGAGTSTKVRRNSVRDRKIRRRKLRSANATDRAISGKKSTFQRSESDSESSSSSPSSSSSSSSTSERRQEPTAFSEWGRRTFELESAKSLAREMTKERRKKSKKSKKSKKKGNSKKRK